MQKVTWGHKLQIGLKRDPFKLLKCTFIAYSVLWAILEPLLAFYDGNVKGWSYYVLLLVISFAIGIYKVIPPSSIEIKIKNSNTIVKLFFGDLFELDGHRVIPVNEYFDSQLGDLVSPLSLHGLFINRILGGVSTSFDTIVRDYLKTISSETEPQKREGNKEKYPIGTTVVFDTNQTRYYLLALSVTNPVTLKAAADVPMLWQALIGLWHCVRINSNGFPVNVPLIGTGLSNTGIPYQQILQFIMSSILIESKKTEINKEIRIVIDWTKFNDVDLERIRYDWI